MQMSELRISKKFFDNRDYLSEGYQLVFNIGKNKLCYKKTEKIQGCETRIDEIISRINAAEKPTFQSIERYRNLHGKLRAINRLSNQKIDLIAFNNQLKPAYFDLQERIWAVHATSVLPEDGVITPWSRHVDYKPDERHVSSRGFSNTLHFSLGELVRPHDRIMSWDLVPYAVVTPLHTLLNQTVNIFTYDTVILRGWKIADQATLLVPIGTDVTLLGRQKFKVVSYPKTLTLRDAVVQEIVRNNGLHLRMANQLGVIGSRAFLDGDINVNSMAFFSALFERMPQLSFGEVMRSMRGQADSLEFIRHLTVNLTQLFKEIEQEMTLTKLQARYVLIKIYEALLKHHIERGAYFLNDDEHQEIALYVERCESVPFVQPNLASYHMQGDLFSHLTLAELGTFKTRNPDLFVKYNRSEFEMEWAMARWLLIGTQKAKSESIDILFESFLSQLISTNPQKISDHFVNLVHTYLEIGTKSSTTLLQILRLEITRKYVALVGKTSLFSGDYNANSVQEVLQSHVVVGKLARDQGNVLDWLIQGMSHHRVVHMKLILCWKPIPLEKDSVKIKGSFAHLHDATEFIALLPKQVEGLEMPIKDNVWTGIYRKQYPSATLLWKCAGLEESFNTLFPKEDDFWESQESYISIYHRLIQ